MIHCYDKDISSKISLLRAGSLATSDLYCTYCDYMGNILINENWITYQNPNFDLIIRKHVTYMKWLELCPQAIRYVLKEYMYFCCPGCDRSRLHISGNSTFHPEWIRSSLNCHNVS